MLIGITLADRDLSDAAVGVVLASLLAGIALVSVLIARYGDRVGRRRCYRLLFVVMAVAGTVFALTTAACRTTTRQGHRSPGGGCAAGQAAT